MKIEYEHNKTKDEAYKAIDGFLSELKKGYKKMIEGYSESWNSSKDVMNFIIYTKKFEISGKMQLYDNLVVLEGNVPFWAKWKIEPKIKQKLEEIL